MKDDDSPRDPIAERLAAEGARLKDAKDVAEGERIIKKAYADRARESGHVEVERLVQLFAKRVESYNANPPKGFPLFVSGPRGVHAGKFQIYLDPFLRLEDFILTLTIGLDSNIAQRMVEPPDIRPAVSRFRAQVDDDGFAWLHLQTGTKYQPERIVEMSLEWLANFLLADAA